MDDYVTWKIMILLENDGGSERRGLDWRERIAFWAEEALVMGFIVHCAIVAGV
jgi:hypothetical protein